MGWFSGWFEPSSKTLTCPYCQQPATFTKEMKVCPNTACKAELPPLFYDTAEKLPVLSVPLIGWTGCGKTVALEAMFHRLESLRALWPGFTVECLSDDTLQWSRAIRQDLAKGRLPVSTQDRVQTPYPFALNELRRWRGKFHGRTLVVRDYPGEAFRSLTIPHNQMVYIGKARVLMMMFCLSDLLDPEQNTNQNVIHTLLESYIHTLRKQGEDIKKRRPGVVVVLSQADRLLAEPDFPGHLRDYVRNDPLVKDVAANTFRPDTPEERSRADAEVNEYVKSMTKVSQSIEQYLISKQPASMGQMITLAKRNEIRLRYCLISALGHEPDRDYRWPPPDDKRRGKLRETPVAYRVLDPLYSALELEREM